MNEYGFPDLTHAELAHFLVACLNQRADDPRKVAGDLLRGYAQLHAPQPAPPYDREADHTARFLLIPGGAA